MIAAVCLAIVVLAVALSAAGRDRFQAYDSPRIYPTFQSDSLGMLDDGSGCVGYCAAPDGSCAVVCR